MRTGVTENTPARAGWRPVIVRSRRSHPARIIADLSEAHQDIDESVVPVRRIYAELGHRPGALHDAAGAVELEIRGRREVIRECAAVNARERSTRPRPDAHELSGAANHLNQRTGRLAQGLAGAKC